MDGTWMRGRLRAIVQQRCPVCLEGRMFRGAFAMFETCPVCGHRFEREPGFFQGAMYVSYGLGLLEAFALVGLAMLLLVPRIGMIGAIGAVVVVHVACVPMLFRYSRVLWAHFFIGTLDESETHPVAVRPGRRR